MHPTKPIYLLADSQLLFWRSENTPFLDSVRKVIESKPAKAAYIGASNNDNPDYHEIFDLAMRGMEIEDWRPISSSCSKSETSYLNQAELIFLAGGDVEKGWRTFEGNGLKELIIRRYSEGALLMGLSAGAVQLGMFGWSEASRGESLFETFGLVPFVIGAHEEKSDWQMLRRVLQVAEINVAGLGIPSGGGMIYHPDASVEAVRYPLQRFSLEQNRIKHELLHPSSG